MSLSMGNYIWLFHPAYSAHPFSLFFQRFKWLVLSYSCNETNLNNFIFTESHNHRHLREIDCSLAVVGRPAAGAECGGKLIH